MHIIDVNCVLPGYNYSLALLFSLSPYYILRRKVFLITITIEAEVNNYKTIFDNDGIGKIATWNKERVNCRAHALMNEMKEKNMDLLFVCEMKRKGIDLNEVVKLLTQL